MLLFFVIINYHNHQPNEFPPDLAHGHYSLWLSTIKWNEVILDQIITKNFNKEFNVDNC